MDNLSEALKILIKNQDTNLVETIDEQLKSKYEEVCELLHIDDEIIKSYLLELQNTEDNSIRWKYISLLFYILLSIKDVDDTFNINFLNGIKKAFQFIISLGLIPHLLPGVGIDLNKRGKNLHKISLENLAITQQYYRLTGTVRGLLLCSKINILRNYIVANYFNDLLASLLQLCYAPVKKPMEIVDKTQMENLISVEFYNQVIQDKSFFQQNMNEFLSNIAQTQVFQELMYFYGTPTSPRWLKIRVYKILNVKLQEPKGAESLLRALIVSGTIDTGTEWKRCEVFAKLLMTNPQHIPGETYYINVCTQILEFTDLRIVTYCVQYLFESNEIDCTIYLLDPILQRLTKYSKSSKYEVKEGSITTEIQQTVLLLKYCFTETSGTMKTLPIALLRPLGVILFHLLVITQESTFDTLKAHITELLVKYLDNSEEEHRKNLFDSFLFESQTEGVLEMKPNIEIKVQDNHLNLKLQNAHVRLDAICKGSCLLHLITTHSSNSVISLCLYLLQLSTSEFTSSVKSSTDLLHLELDETFVIDESTERKLVAYRLLSNLVDDQKVRSYLKRDPKAIVAFIETTINNFIKNQIHTSENYDSGQFQTLFLLIVIISIIVKDLNEFQNLKQVLTVLKFETRNIELKNLIGRISNGNGKSCSTEVEKDVSDYRKAIEDVCDPLLPIQGHGLLALVKLIAQKDPETLENKQYILNICQHHIKCDDSYIYLNAIELLATLGDCFPDVVLNILTEEYANETKDIFENGNEIRMKLGEVLLRIVRSLGVVASKYKSLLLNTFLTGARDEDNLIRASALSNLGELCQVLGYKLGTVVTDILSCVHAIIITDKAVEARRAAVSVLRGLFIGLDQEMVVFLKDEILPIYRTLKNIYANDSDEVTRLQAQLALEELNENVKKFIFPKQQLDKKTGMLE